MKPLSTLFFLCLTTLSFAGEPLPHMSPALTNEIQRLAITLDVAEFPVAQNDLAVYLALPPYQMGAGEIEGGKANMRFHRSDPKDPLGEYQLKIYCGSTQTGDSQPLVVKVELVFCAGNLGNFPPTGDFVLTADRSSDVIGRLRKQMHERKMTPGEYVRSIYKQ